MAVDRAKAIACPSMSCTGPYKTTACHEFQVG